LIGGESVGQPALRRFFAFHVILFPAAIVVLMSWHFWRIRKDGGLASSGLESQENVKKIPSWPSLLWAELAVFMLVVTLLMSVSILADAPLLSEANPELPENPAKSPWYFLGVQELVSFSAFSGGILIPMLLFFFLFSIPYYGNAGSQTGKWPSAKGELRTIWQSALAGLIVMFLLYLPLVIGSTNFWRFPGNLGMIINPGLVYLLVSILWARIMRWRYSENRIMVLAVFTMAMTGVIVFTLVGIWLRGADWHFMIG
jgi:quinol-cytochrome oxidoreductase complex cytochrome b subunit